MRVSILVAGVAVIALQLAVSVMADDPLLSSSSDSSLEKRAPTGGHKHHGKHGGGCGSGKHSWKRTFHKGHHKGGHSHGRCRCDRGERHHGHREQEPIYVPVPVPVPVHTHGEYHGGMKGDVGIVSPGVGVDVGVPYGGVGVNVGVPGVGVGVDVGGQGGVNVGAPGVGVNVGFLTDPSDDSHPASASSKAGVSSSLFAQDSKKGKDEPSNKNKSETSAKMKKLVEKASEDLSKRTFHKHHHGGHGSDCPCDCYY